MMMRDIMLLIHDDLMTRRQCDQRGVQRNSSSLHGDDNDESRKDVLRRPTNTRTPVFSEGHDGT